MPGISSTLIAFHSPRDVQLVLRLASDYLVIASRCALFISRTLSLIASPSCWGYQESGNLCEDSLVSPDK